MFKYLRLSITDRCNFRCIYCMPEEGICKKSHSEILRFEELLPIVKVAVKTGVEQVRITGGEPLVRRGVVGFVAELAKIQGLKDLCLTTNASRLADMADDLKKAGLGRVNISLDSLNPQTFRKITRLGDLDKVLAGIYAAVDAGLAPVKINVVIIPGVNDVEIPDFARFARDNPVHVRFIERMPFPGAGKGAEYYSEAQILETISSNFELIDAESGESFGPSRNFQIKGGKGVIGFISPRTRPFCESCRRLRLTSNGYLLPCLDSTTGIMVRGMADSDLEKVIAELFANKKAWHKNQACFKSTFDSSLSKIGG
ncbi:MAG: GTP 3',8-cyclase MoaA [Candidatus Rifleibacteriota bacterium]